MDVDREQGELRHLLLLESREYLFLERREHNHPTELTARNHFTLQADPDAQPSPTKPGM